MSDKEKDMNSREKELLPQIIEDVLKLDNPQLIYMNGFLAGMHAQEQVNDYGEKKR